MMNRRKKVLGRAGNRDTRAGSQEIINDEVEIAVF